MYVLAEVLSEAHLAPGARVACIGSRRLSAGAIAACESGGADLARAGYVVSSGGAQGADQAFMRGALGGGGRVVCYLPWARYEAEALASMRHLGGELSIEVYDPARDTEWLSLAEANHPAWERCSRGARSLHARNSGIVLGRASSERAAVVVAMPSVDYSGGTMQGMRLSQTSGVAVWDLRSGGWWSER